MRRCLTRFDSRAIDHYNNSRLAHITLPNSEDAALCFDYDSPWKEALDVYFESFLALLFPTIHRQIDWSRGWESLDKEFQQVVREAEVGRRYVDKLVKVWTKEGVERWVLIHVEVQTTRDADFPERMYVYNYRVFDRYNQKVASLAVLADDDPAWRPASIVARFSAARPASAFVPVKLLDFAAREATLEASTNPFAPVVLATTKMRSRRVTTPTGRLGCRKLRLVRNLYERGFSATDVRELFRLIDWLMELPPALNESFSDTLLRTSVQEEKRMPYVRVASVGNLQGIRVGIEAVVASAARRKKGSS